MRITHINNMDYRASTKHFDNTPKGMKEAQAHWHFLVTDGFTYCAVWDMGNRELLQFNILKRGEHLYSPL